MKLYSKILLTTIPLILFSLLAAVTTSYYFANKGLTDLAEAWLRTRLSDAASLVSDHQAMIENYGLENVSASVAKAKMDASEALLEIDLGEKGYIFVVDASGVIVVHPQEDQIGRQVNHSEWFKTMVSNKQGRLAYGFDRVNFLAQYRFFPPWDWYIIAAEPESEVYGVIRQMRPWVLGLILIGSMVMAMVLMFLTRKITTPLSVLEAGARQIGQGNLEAHILLNTKDELGSLAEVFNRMAGQLRETLAELRHSEKHFRSLIENSSDIVTLIDDQGVIKYESPSVERMLGYLPDEPVGGPYIDFVHHQDQPLVARIFKYLKEKPEDIQSAELRFRHRDGSFRHFEAIFNNRLGDPVVTGLVVNSRDITERKRAVAALRESEKRYRDLFSNISDIILTHDIDGHFITVNPAAINSFGYSPRELVGRRLDEFHRPEDIKLCHENYMTPLRSLGRVDGVARLLNKAGEDFYVEYSSVLIEAEGEDPYVSCSGRDVTERIRAQKELKRMEEQLLQSRKMEAMGILASGIAHDFNNILQVISGYIELLSARVEQHPKNRTYLKEVGHTVERASELVKRLLTFSRRVEPNLKPVNLNHDVIQTVNILTRTIPKMIGIETDLAENLHWIHGDSNQLEQVILNICTNAKDAMPNGGRLLLETRNLSLDEKDSQAFLDLAPGDYVVLRISDNGKGMDQETVEHLFEPFFTTKGVGEGTGLGLSTVYGIVKGHNGYINCLSEPGRGTVFDMYFPKLDQEHVPVIENRLPAPSIPGGKETLLLVDDEISIMEVARETFEDHGYKILVAASGEEALDIYRSEGKNIHLIILDLGMPGMGGYQCLKELIKMDPETRVIVASGYSAADNAAATLSAGARAFIGKPYGLNEMLRRVREILDGNWPEG